jgi:hypothetical protein
VFEVWESQGLGQSMGLRVSVVNETSERHATEEPLRNIASKLNFPKWTTMSQKHEWPGSSFTTRLCISQIPYHEKLY